MTKPVIGFPGPGGSMGVCGVCGDGFIIEVLLGQKVGIIGHPDLMQDFAVHGRCKKSLTELWAAKKWRDLPDGPLRRCIEQSETKQ